MKERFENRRVLAQTLKHQTMVGGDQALAEELADRVTLDEISAGATIIEQGAADNDIFFILIGSFNVVINGRPIATREKNNHVGEISAEAFAALRTPNASLLHRFLLRRPLVTRL